MSAYGVCPKIFVNNINDAQQRRLNVLAGHMSPQGSPVTTGAFSATTSPKAVVANSPTPNSPANVYASNQSTYFMAHTRLGK
jgi:hypothetical protein